MQALGVISINIWQMLISLCNLLILCRILRRFFFQPIRGILREREQAVEADYAAAETARTAAEAAKADCEKEQAFLRAEKRRLLQEARAAAKKEQLRILEETKEQASQLLLEADEEARRTKEREQDKMLAAAAEASVRMAEELLRREVTAGDQRRLVGQFLAELGEAHE